ncbi:MAG TPA: DinB family protein [Dehalococcoidia bacterium]|nr:DinB family protein [Dehalococcoidia bacterium]
MDSGWQELLATVKSYPPEELTRPNVIGAWSVKDLLVHISSWETEFLQAMPLILADQRLPRYSTTYGGIDAFNALVQERAKGLPQDEVLRAFAQSHERLVAAIRSLAPALLQGRPRTHQRLARRLRQDTYGHYAEHALELPRWRGANS